MKDLNGQRLQRQAAQGTGAEGSSWAGKEGARAGVSTGAWASLPLDLPSAVTLSSCLWSVPCQARSLWGGGLCLPLWAVTVGAE